MIYKVTYPNGKIYIGRDITDSINYFGSADAALISRDFTEGQRRSFTVTRDLLWGSTSASLGEVTRKEIEFIRALRSNDPAIGYNRWLRPVKVVPSPADSDQVGNAGMFEMGAAQGAPVDSTSEKGQG